MPQTRYASSSIEPVWRYLQRLSAILRKAWRLALPYPSAPTQSHTASQLTTHHISADVPRYSLASPSSPRMVARFSSGVNSYMDRLRHTCHQFAVVNGVGQRALWALLWWTRNFCVWYAHTLPGICNLKLLGCSYTLSHLPSLWLHRERASDDTVVFCLGHLPGGGSSRCKKTRQRA